MDEYGIKLTSFYVNEVSIPEEDLAVKKLKDAWQKSRNGYYWIQLSAATFV